MAAVPGAEVEPEEGDISHTTAAPVTDDSSGDANEAKVVPRKLDTPDPEFYLRY